MAFLSASPTPIPEYIGEVQEVGYAASVTGGSSPDTDDKDKENPDGVNSDVKIRNPAFKEERMAADLPTTTQEPQQQTQQQPQQVVAPVKQSKTKFRPEWEVKTPEFDTSPITTEDVPSVDESPKFVYIEYDDSVIDTVSKVGRGIKEGLDDWINANLQRSAQNLRASADMLGINISDESAVRAVKATQTLGKVEGKVLLGLLKYGVGVGSAQAADSAVKQLGKASVSSLPPSGSGLLEAAKKATTSETTVVDLTELIKNLVR